jgi:hypothetical protein
MATALELLAFPILPLIAAGIWIYNERRYRRFLASIGADRPMTSERLFANGPLGVYKDAVADRGRGDALVRSGKFGQGPLVLLKRERTSWYAFLATGIGGLIGSLGLTYVLPRLGVVGSLEIDGRIVFAIAAALVGVHLALGLRAILMARNTEHAASRAAIGQRIGWVGATIGLVIWLLWITRPVS